MIIYLGGAAFARFSGNGQMREPRTAGRAKGTVAPLFCIYVNSLNLKTKNRLRWGD